MAIKRLLMTLSFVVGSIVSSSGVSFALATADGSSGSTFVWSQISPTVGAKLKVSEVVSSSRKGIRAFRATGACTFRKDVLSFNRAGNCRVSVSVKLDTTGKVLRSSKVFAVKPENAVAATPASGMPDPIGCTKASKNPLSGTPYPDSRPGIYDFQTAWTCDAVAIDARPLLEYFKSQGWTAMTTTDGVVKASMKKDSKRMNYLEDPSEMPAGQTLLILTIK